jgi:hypothetical protein
MAEWRRRSGRSAREEQVGGKWRKDVVTDPLDVPVEVVDYLAEQLGIEDPSCVKRYTERRETRFEHAREIQQEYGLTAFAAVVSELAAWVADQAWMTGDGPKAIYFRPAARRPSKAMSVGQVIVEQLVEVPDAALLVRTVGDAGALGRP